MTAQVVILYDELDACWLKKGHFINRECNVKQRKYKHKVFFAIDFYNFILLTFGIILISFVFINGELNRIFAVFETSAQFITKCFIEVGRLEKKV